MRPGSAAGPNAPRPIGRADPIKTPPRQSEAGSPADSASPRHADDPEPTPAHAKDYQPRQPPTTSATPSTRFAQHLESGGGRVASPNLSRLFRTESPWFSSRHYQRHSWLISLDGILCGSENGQTQA